MRPRVLAIHDLSGFGNTSLMAVIPIMSRYGIQVCALPTAVLSANTCYPHYQWLDTSDFMRRAIDHYKELGHRFSAIYSGFLGSTEQVQTVISAIRILADQDTLVVVDPVMADEGELYSCYSQDMVASMRSLIAVADLITPNFTEACLLADWPYRTNYTDEDLDVMCHKITDYGPKKLIITSVPDASGQGSRVVYFNPDSGVKHFSCKYIPAFYPGTGDIFCSMLLAKLLGGIAIEVAIPQVTDFIYRAIAYSMQSAEDQREGVLLESILWQER